ncbi:MAG TPA: NUDIX domain-containing protein [Anaerolineales bacterium]|nr:NUDIX domain-containing protein [Anaerolineales bacterium]
MRIRAGIILIEEDKVALIERYRAGYHYYSFPGGGVNVGESLEHAAIRETLEELGLEVAIRQKVAEVQIGNKSRQAYFLVEQTGGEFGTGTGEEYSDANRAHPQKGIYIPIWMPVAELPQHMNVYPAEVAHLVVKSVKDGWASEPILTLEEPE